MKRNIALLSLLIFSLIMVQAQTSSIYQFKVKDINGETFDMSSLKGKKFCLLMLPQNVDYPQYEQLEIIR